MHHDTTATIAEHGTLMRCGHAASGLHGDAATGHYCCIVCSMDSDLNACVVEDAPPDLSGREARCSCGRTAPSDPHRLAFFEYTGPGSPESRERCAECRYTIRAHAADTWSTSTGRTDHEFVPAGPAEFDRFYCGHAGWN